MTFVFEATEVSDGQERIELQPGALGSKENRIKVSGGETLKTLCETVGKCSRNIEDANLHLGYRGQDYVYEGPDNGVRLETFHGTRKDGSVYEIDMTPTVLYQASQENRTDILAAHDECLKMNDLIEAYRSEHTV